MIRGALLAGAGGFVGSALRYAVGVLVIRLTGNPHFPWGTLAVNLGGCFLIGLAAGLSGTRAIQSSDGRAFLIVGILGGFTTFSAFGWETLELARNGQTLLAGINVALQLVLGLSAVAAGLGAARLLSP